MIYEFHFLISLLYLSMHCVHGNDHVGLQLIGPHNASDCAGRADDRHAILREMEPRAAMERGLVLIR